MRKKIGRFCRRMALATQLNWLRWLSTAGVATIGGSMAVECAQRAMFTFAFQSDSVMFQLRAGVLTLAAIVIATLTAALTSYLYRQLARPPYVQREALHEWAANKLAA